MHIKTESTGFDGFNLIGHRLKTEMKKRGITSVELARRSDVKTSFLYDVISGKSSNPSTVKLARVAETLGVTLNYLVGNSDNIPDISAGAPDEYVIIPRLLIDLSAGTNTIISELAQGEAYCFRSGWIREHLHAEPNDLRMLYVRGDSMVPTLCHNDLVLVDTTRKTPSPPGIFVLFDGFGLVAKRLEHISGPQSGRIRVISDNPQYSIYERNLADTQIIGHVVWFARQI